MPHKHAAMIMAYAEKAQVSETPWEYFDGRKVGQNEWKTLTGTSLFFDTYDYRLKPTMSTPDVNSSTEQILDYLSNDCEWAADVLVERWAGLRSENQTQRKRIQQLEKERDALVGENKHLKLCAELANDRSDFNNRRI